MSNLRPPESLNDALQRLAGYVNYSSGSEDPAIAAAWNQVYTTATGGDPLSGAAGWLVLKDWLSETLQRLSEEQAAFRDVQQAQRVIRLLWSELLPAYVDYHRDLLFHQEPVVLFNGFFLARAADAILLTGTQDTDDIGVCR